MEGAGEGKVGTTREMTHKHHSPFIASGLSRAPSSRDHPSCPFGETPSLSRSPLRDTDIPLIAGAWICDGGRAPVGV